MVRRLAGKRIKDPVGLVVRRLASKRIMDPVGLVVRRLAREKRIQEIIDTQVVKMNAI